VTKLHQIEPEESARFGQTYQMCEVCRAGLVKNCLRVRGIADRSLHSPYICSQEFQALIQFRQLAGECLHHSLDLAHLGRTGYELVVVPVANVKGQGSAVQQRFALIRGHPNRLIVELLAERLRETRIETSRLESPNETPRQRVFYTIAGPIDRSLPTRTPEFGRD
jgi:hypothetical protein